MEHIVNFGITIDDELIKETIIKNAKNEVVNAIKKDVIRNLGCSNNSEYNRFVDKKIYEEIDCFLEKYKEEIISSASDKLAERLVKTKAVKEAVEDVLKGVL